MNFVAEWEISKAQRRRLTDLFHDLSFLSCSFLGSIDNAVLVDRYAFFPGTFVVGDKSCRLRRLSRGLLLVHMGGRTGAGFSGAREIGRRPLANVG